AAGEEVLPEERKQDEAAETEQEKGRNEDDAGFDEALEDVLIGAAKAFEAALEAALEAGKDVARGSAVLVMRLEQVHRHGGHQRSRQNVGGEHGEDDGFGERHEEEEGDAAEEEHRQ